MANSPNDLGSQQAFPHTLVTKDAFGNQYTKAGFGLTKRELLAAMAMQGLCACPEIGDTSGEKTIATMAVAQADALLAALTASQDFSRPDRHHLGTTVEEREGK